MPLGNYKTWLLLASFIATSCRAKPLTLHGFYGGFDFKNVAHNLLPQDDRRDVFPKNWNTAIPIENYSGLNRPLYIDGPLLGGKDSLPFYGIESSTLTFYAGEGATDHWSVSDPFPLDTVPISYAHVGDGDLRYFWLYSCHVMAHGPLLGGDYSAPQCFKEGTDKKGGADKDADAFQSWAHSLGPNIRMVCGGSTFFSYTHVEEIWNYLLEDQTSVTDAFVLGLAHNGQVPLCLMRGGPDPASSALGDRALHSEGVTQGGWLHAQYPVTCKIKPFGSMLQVTCGGAELCTTSSKVPKINPGSIAQSPADVIKVLPDVRIAPLPTPDLTPAPLDGPLPLGFFQLAGNSRLKFHPMSGAEVLIKRRDRYSSSGPCNRETHWTFQPETLLARTGLDPKAFLFASSEVDDARGSADDVLTALEMRIESRKEGAKIGDCRVRSLFLLLRNEIDVGAKSKPEAYPVFGPATVLELQQGAKGRPVLASFSEPYHSVTVAKEETPVDIKPPKEVIREAYQALQLKPEEYSVDDARAVLGYEKAPLRCSQKSLRPTYEIQFFPTAAAQRDRSTVIVRRDARRDTSKASWTCSDWGEERD